MIACAAPNPSIDRLFATSALLPGAIHRPDAAAADAGGKGLNAARAAHVLGADVRAVALVAGHAGRWIADRLAADGVAADLVWGAGETRTCLSVAAGGALTEFYEPGDPPGDDVWAAFAARVAAVAGRASWVALSGSLPPGVDAAEAARLVAAARAAGARVAVDQRGRRSGRCARRRPGSRQGQRRRGGGADRRGRPARRRDRAARAATAAAHPVVAVTLGERGALLLAGDEALHGRSTCVRPTRSAPATRSSQGCSPRRRPPAARGATRSRSRSARAPRTPSSRAPAASIPTARGRSRDGSRARDPSDRLGPMNRAERLGAIMERLADHGNVDVEALTQALHVSPATVRRDLQALHEQRLLERTHGGAVAIGGLYELPMRYRSSRQREDKLRIAEAALAHVRDGMSVAVTGGTTTTEVARALVRREDLTIVTNAINIAAELAVRSNIRLVVTGGVARSASFELVGPLAELVLDHVHVDIAFVGVDGIAARAG